MTDFGMRLREAAADKGMYLCDVAEAIGVGRYTIYNWADQRYYPSAPKLALLCKVLDVSADYMLGLTPPPPPPPAPAKKRRRRILT